MIPYISKWKHKKQNKKRKKRGEGKTMTNDTKEHEGLQSVNLVTDHIPEAGLSWS